MKKYVVFNIGGTNIKYGVMDEEGNSIRDGVMPTQRFEGDKIIEDLLRVVNEYKKIYELSGIAFSIPGFVDVEKGIIHDGGAIKDFDKLNLKKIIEEKTGLITKLDNDVNCVALAEKWKGEAKECRNFLCMTIGTGIGGGIFINDTLYRGSSYMAGEFGYMLTEGLTDDFWESMMSSKAGLYGLISKVAERKNVSKESLSGKAIFDLAESGNNIAREEVDNFYRNLAIGIFNLTYLFNPEKILIGGAISSRKDLIEKIKEKMEKSKPGITKIVKIDKCKYENEAGKIGALYNFLTMTK